MILETTDKLVDCTVPTEPFMRALLLPSAVASALEAPKPAIKPQAVPSGRALATSVDSDSSTMAPSLKSTAPASTWTSRSALAVALALTNLPETPSDPPGA